MSKLYDAFQGLAPLDFRILPKTGLEKVARKILLDAELIAGSVPPPSGGLPLSASNISSAEANNATNVLGMRPSAVRPPRAKEEHEALWGSWGKRVDVPPRAGLLDTPIYKITSSSRGRNVNWYGLRTIQEGLGFEKWKCALNHEFESAYGANAIPLPSVRSISVDKVLFSRVFPKIGILQVVQGTIRQPNSTTTFDNSSRDVLMLRLISNSRAKYGAHSAKARPPRQRVCVSLPLLSFIAEDGAHYTSKTTCFQTVEIIREVPYVQFKAEREILRLKEELRKERELKFGIGRSGSRRINGQRPMSLAVDSGFHHDFINVSNPSYPVDHREIRVNGRASLPQGGVKRSDSQRRNTFVLSPIPPDTRRSLDRSSYPTRSSFNLTVNAMLEKLANGSARDPSIIEPEGDIESNPVEWILVTRPDGARPFSRLMGDRHFQTTMAYDATRFINWACSIREWEKEEDEDVPPPSPESSSDDAKSDVDRFGACTLENILSHPEPIRTNRVGTHNLENHEYSKRPSNVPDMPLDFPFLRHGPNAVDSGRTTPQADSPSQWDPAAYRRDVTQPREHSGRAGRNSLEDYPTSGAAPVSPWASDLSGQMPGIALTADSAISSDKQFHDLRAGTVPSPRFARSSNPAHPYVIHARRPSHQSVHNQTSSPSVWDNRFALPKERQRGYDSAQPLAYLTPDSTSRPGSFSGSSSSLTPRNSQSPSFSFRDSPPMSSVPEASACFSRASDHGSVSLPSAVNRNSTPMSHFSVKSGDTFYTALQSPTPTDERIHCSDSEDIYHPDAADIGDAAFVPRPRSDRPSPLDLTPPISGSHSVAGDAGAAAETTPTASSAGFFSSQFQYPAVARSESSAQSEEFHSFSDQAVPQDPPSDQGSALLNPASPSNRPPPDPVPHGLTDPGVSKEFHSPFPPPPNAPGVPTDDTNVLDAQYQVSKARQVFKPLPLPGVNNLSESRRQSWNSLPSPSGPPPAQPAPPPVPTAPATPASFSAIPSLPNLPPSRFSGRTTLEAPQSRVASTQSIPFGNPPDSIALPPEPEPIGFSSLSASTSTSSRGEVPLRPHGRKLTKPVPVSFDRFVSGSSKRSTSVESQPRTPVSEVSSNGFRFGSRGSSGAQDNSTIASSSHTPTSSRRGSASTPDRGRRNSLASAGTYLLRKLRHKGNNKGPNESSQTDSRPLSASKGNAIFGDRSDMLSPLSMVTDDSAGAPTQFQPSAEKENGSGLTASTNGFRAQVPGQDRSVEKKEIRSALRSSILRSSVSPPADAPFPGLHSPSPPSTVGTAAPPTPRSSIAPVRSSQSSRNSSVVAFAPEPRTERFSVSSGMNSPVPGSTATAAAQAVSSAKRWRTLYELSAKENSTLRSQVEELQLKLTALTIVLGKSEQGKNFLRDAADLRQQRQRTR